MKRNKSYTPCLLSNVKERYGIAGDNQNGDSRPTHGLLWAV